MLQLQCCKKNIELGHSLTMLGDGGLWCMLSSTCFYTIYFIYLFMCLFVYLCIYLIRTAHRTDANFQELSIVTFQNT